MKKTILASAIAAASFSGAAFAQESNLPTVYGNIQYVITHSDIDGGPSDVEHADNGSTLGVKHDHEIAPGLSGFFKAELEFDADDKSNNNGLDQFDEAYIGVRSDRFGTIWVGSDDSTYERVIDEIYNYYELGSPNIAGSYDTGEGDLIQYSTPGFGGFQLHAAVQFNGDGDEWENDTGDTVQSEKSYPYQLAATYSVDALELAVAMDSNDGDTQYSKDDDKPSFNNENTYGLRASYTLGDLRLTGQYQTRKDVVDQFGLFAGYTLGKNQFAISYELAQYDKEFTRQGEGDLDRDTVTLQALHNLSDNMYIYAEGYFGGGDDVYDTETVDADDNEVFSDEKTVAAVGAVYNF
jgi:predicted porin